MAVARAPKKRITFKFVAPEAERVILAGSFNGWADGGTPLKRDSKGIWKTQVSLEPGRYEYRFVVDGAQWCSDPRAQESVPNEFGSTNSVVVV